jgi:hypothetical protein
MNSPLLNEPLQCVVGVRTCTSLIGRKSKQAKDDDLFKNDFTNGLRIIKCAYSQNFRNFGSSSQKLKKACAGIV